MMAAAEARAVWQRTVNRCKVQEDAKRAPKLASSSSSSSSSPSSSKQKVDLGNNDASNVPDHSPACFMHLNWNSSNSNLSLEQKWWLHLQPNNGSQKEFTYEQLNALEAEVESFRMGKDAPICEENKTHMDINKNTVLYADRNCNISSGFLKNDPDCKARELKAMNFSNTPKPLKHIDAEKYWFKDDSTMDLDPVDQLLLKQTFDFETPWMGSGKTDPWWRTVTKDELASLVAQKSLGHIENCDLPPPRSTKVRRNQRDCLDDFDQDKVFSSSLDLKPNTAVRCSSLTSGFAEKGYSFYSSEKPSSYSTTNSSSTFSKDSTETQQTSDSELSNAKLLEALRHSQTRAREAEKAAQQAFSEKEHILKLVFKQASHLFAYKQWIQLLQLETICLQLKNNDHFPAILPWMPNKGKQRKRGRQKPDKGKRGPRRYDIGKYAVAFAVGLGLVGAGLLLGWNIGWLLPMF